jgi:hypothetical protein
MLCVSEVRPEKIDLGGLEDLPESRRLGEPERGSTERAERALDALRPNRRRLGSSDSSCSVVVTRCIRGSSGPSRPSPLDFDLVFLGMMNPYRSTSAPSRSAQSSSPPAVSVGSLTITLPCRELISELVSSLPSTTTDEPLAGVLVTALLPR